MHKKGEKCPCKAKTVRATYGEKKATGKLTAFQENFMKTHSKNHTKKHNDMMIKLMKGGKCPEKAHIETMKKVGK